MKFRWTSAEGRKTPEKAEQPAEKLAVGVPLARIVPRKLIETPDLLFRGNATSPAAERFRRLRTVLTTDVAAAPQVIIVTSAIPGDGKSFVAMNLALAFAADGETSTLLIDADLRRPALDRYITPEPTLGLSDLLEEKVPLQHTVLHLKDTSLEVLPAGKSAKEPVELLGSQVCANLFAQLRTRYERIIVDTPPALPFTDADVIGRNADGALFVVRQGSTPKNHYRRAVGMLTSVRVLGSVLNDSTYSLADRGHYYDKYYQAYYNRDGKK
ncbi:MAG TPA: CpsD/CapB family tyrosine-protein kinase [Candidatus Polarisedimenticolaceae bacterium]|nr:CpsD/CapB family tyrosine-protein kinase [Candidatus Polarisedimenticolaceae bacterium]